MLVPVLVEVFPHTLFAIRMLFGWVALLFGCLAEEHHFYLFIMCSFHVHKISPAVIHMLAIFHPFASSSLTFTLSLVACFVGKQTKTREKPNSGSRSKEEETNEAPLHIRLSFLSIAFQANLSSSPNSISVYPYVYEPSEKEISSAATAYVNAFINAFPLLFRFVFVCVCAQQSSTLMTAVRTACQHFPFNSNKSDSNIRTK